METGNSGHYVPGSYLNLNKNKKNSGVRWLWIIVTIAAFLGAYNYFKDAPKEGAKAPQNYSNYQNVPNPEAGLTKSEIMQKYFPLKVGNSWTYKRTLIDPDNVFSYTEKTTTEAGWDIPKGIRYFTVGRSLFEEKTGISHETYTIIGESENNCFSVQVKGSENPRDGRYNDIYSSSIEDRNIRWQYVSRGVWEILDGNYADTKTRDQIWSVLLDSDILISNPSNDDENPSWIIGSTMSDNEITVPAGTFKNCLKNVTVVGGSNIEDIIKNDSPIKYLDKDGFGCFVNKSYYAKNIGLILEIQFDKKNNLVYKLELESYKINWFYV